MMRSIMARSPHDSSLSFSKRHFRWIVGKLNGEGTSRSGGEGGDEEEILAFSTSINTVSESVLGAVAAAAADKHKKEEKKKSPSSAAAAAVVKLRSVLSGKKTRPSKVTGTLFGHRRGHIRFTFQFESKSMILIELAMLTSTLVKEMASGLVRIALECERREPKKQGKLLEETLWRAYCNGNKCGYAVRREFVDEDLKVLTAVGPVSMGAGVLPFGGGGDIQGEMMYMRAKFERVVGSKDSEAFYMMNPNPDANSGPELTIYLLRV